MINPIYEKQIQIAANHFKLDVDLITAICQVESAFRPFAARYEVNYKWTVAISAHSLRLGITYNTEEILQKTSYGLMQVMGGLARDLGFSRHLGELYIPEINLHYGCKYLRKLTDKYGDEDKVISSYNQGSPRMKPSGVFENEVYVDKVYAELRKLRRFEDL